MRGLACLPGVTILSLKQMGNLDWLQTQLCSLTLWILNITNQEYKIVWSKFKSSLSEILLSLTKLVPKRILMKYGNVSLSKNSSSTSNTQFTLCNLSMTDGMLLKYLDLNVPSNLVHFLSASNLKERLFKIIIKMSLLLC